MKGAIFDLDGVIVDTAKYHYLAWKEIAKELGFDFKESDNERLKGVSRMASLEILLEVGNIRNLTQEQKLKIAEKKNNRYLEFLSSLNEGELIDGAKEYLISLKNSGVKVALGSASKNAPFILEKLKISDLFDVVVDGNSISKAKPDPEVFLKAAEGLGLPAEECCVFEDSQAGIDAAVIGGFHTVAVDKTGVLHGYERRVDCLGDLL
ncbi:MAG: beta-phosphoglucomutase [Clostridia bacterium]|nr:beta-phosphoglucomutase [Clostridia bacterium]